MVVMWSNLGIIRHEAISREFEAANGYRAAIRGLGMIVRIPKKVKRDLSGCRQNSSAVEG